MREKPDSLGELDGAVDVADPDLELRTTRAAGRLAGGCGVPQSEEQGTELLREGLRRRRDAGNSRIDRAVRLEEASDEGAVYGAVVRFEQGGRNARKPTLAGVQLVGERLGESRRLPPARQPDRRQQHLVVPRRGCDRGLDPEEFLAEDAQTIDDVEIGVRHTEPDALGVEAAVPHEVAD